MKCYATVDYLGIVYKGAELVANVWYFEDVHGAMIPFVYQKRVNLLSDLVTRQTTTSDLRFLLLTVKG
jgi:hypothetical protein